MSNTDEAPEAATAGCVALQLAGELIWLTPEKAAVLPRHACALIADAHIGKGELFRSQGIAVPAGSSAATLASLTRLVDRYRLRRIISLGDFLHASPSARIRVLLRDWRSQHAGLRVDFLAGNHDPDVAALAIDRWRVMHTARLGALELRHVPAAGPHLIAVHEPVIAGHVHPVAVFQRGRADRLRLPVFWLRGGQLVLPAFGHFTGGYAVAADRDSARFAVTPSAVLAMD